MRYLSEDRRDNIIIKKICRTNFIYHKDNYKCSATDDPGISEKRKKKLYQRGNCSIQVHYRPVQKEGSIGFQQKILSKCIHLLHKS